jgi:arylsulfatase A-like enzyme
VRGVWNNAEGLMPDNTTLFDLLASAGYTVHVTGKTDWTVGGHSESCFLEAVTHNVAFPYNVSLDGGWAQEDMCGMNATVAKGGTNGPTGSVYQGDWKIVEDNAKYIAAAAQNSSAQPWIVYQGTNIVHPPYATNEYWLGKINASLVTQPFWPDIDEMHPCDLQESMLKGCLPSDAQAPSFNDPERVLNLRRVYLAEIAEFDAMVGAYLDALESSGQADNTVVIVDADHGDMQLDHRSFYKMSAKEGSSRVPLVIAGPGIASQVVTQPTQLLDIFSTVLDIAGIPVPPTNQGFSLVPFLTGSSRDPSRPPYVLSQFHGDDIAMSWFMVARDDGMKYINYGLGNHSAEGVTPQLFNVTADPQERTNLWTPDSPVAKELEGILQSMIDYPSVAMDVAEYQMGQFRYWQGANSDWRKQITDPSIVRWAQAWNDAYNASFAALDEWLSQPPGNQVCRNATVWA